MERQLSLATLAGGVAEELWANELDRVLNNLDDPNTDHKAKRSITITVTFQPDEEELFPATPARLEAVQVEAQP